MLSAVNANSQERLDELGECLKKTKRCSVVATLRQFAERADGTVQEVEIQQQTAESNNVVNVNGDLVYAELTEATGNLFELKKIRAMWKAVLTRGTAQLLKGEPNDYGITIDLICQELEHETVYIVSFFNPSFMSEEDHGIMFAAPLEHFYFGKEHLTLAEIEYEEEQQAQAMSESGNGYGEMTYTEQDEAEYDEEEEFEDELGVTDNSDITDNDDLLRAVRDKDE